MIHQKIIAPLTLLAFSLSATAQAANVKNPAPISVISASYLFSHQRVPKLAPALPAAKITFINHDRRVADTIIFAGQLKNGFTSYYRYQGTFSPGVLIEGQISPVMPLNPSAPGEATASTTLHPIYAHFTDGSNWRSGANTP